MDRNREARRVNMAASNGLPRRRHRSNSLRDSPEDDVVMETQETARLRDRKKERDRDRERERDRDRERERERERERDRMSSRSSKRRRGGERLIHGSSNREDGVGVGDDSSEESVNDDEDEDDDDAGVGASAAGLGASSMRMLPPNHHHHHHQNNTSSLSSSTLSNHHHSNNNTNSNHHHRKSFPLSAKVFRAAPGPGAAASSAAPWKAPDEMIGLSVPRKARSVSTKRSHDCWASSGVGEQIHRQASTSPVRSSGPSGAAMMASASASPAPVSPPSSSTISVKKKMKPNGPKQRPPKSLSSLSKPASSAQEEIEIEIAEVLYGLLRQPQASSKQEMVGTDSMKMDSREMNSNKPTGDAKSRISSPISNSPSTAVPQSSSVPQTNSSSSTTPMPAIAPKRKRPRPVKYEDENPSCVLSGRNNIVSSMTKVVENDQSTKIESNLDKNPGSAAENGSVGFDLLANQVVPPSTEVQTEPVKQENNSVSDAKPLTEASESRDLGVTAKEETRSPSKESNAGLRPGEDRESLTVSKANAKVSEVEAHREEKFQIDLMAPPPPPLRSSPERDSEIDFGSVDPKPMVTDVETELKPVVKEDDKAVKIAKEDMNMEPEEKKAKVMAEVADLRKPNKERNIDLQLDLEKTDRESGSVSSSGNKQHDVQNQKQHQQTHSEKNAQQGSLPLPMSMAGWPGGLPPMGYMAPIQGVVSMDGNTVPSAAIQPPHLLFGQPRPKRCATHCYIARNIHYHQQFTRMNPFWPAAPGSALQFGAKACNVNVVPSPELHPGRGVNSVQDKGQRLAIFPPHSGKDKSSQSSNILDTAQRKQILLQQALPPGAPNNILHGPAFIFPLSQQPGAAGASVRPGTIKSPAAAGSASASSTTSSASISATAAAVAGATAMSFNYPNMSGNETHFLAILQNGAYPIPIPAHVGTNPAYRGTHPPAMPFFNGSFYSSQMLHPSALSQQKQSPSQSPQSQQGHQNPSISSGSSSSQKHLQNQQPRAHASGINGNGGDLKGFPSQKNLPSQPMQLQSRQQNLNHNVPLQTRQLESEVGGEESPSTADSRVSRANMSIYGQNFGLPMHPPPNFTLMTPASVTAANSTSNNPSDKKQQQQPQSHGSKPGVEPFQSQPFAMSFAFNGAAATPGLDISSIAQNHPFLQSLPEAAMHGYYMPTAAAVNPTAQQKKNFRTSEEGKAGGNDGSNVEEERKAMAGGKATMTSGQSIAFSRSDLTDTPGSTMPGNVVIDTSARPLNLGSTPGRAAGSVMSADMSTVAAAGVQQQIQRNQQQQQQMIQLHKQHQFAAAAAASGRSKAPATSNGSVYSDHISTSPSMSSKFPSVISAFPQNLVQSSSSPALSPQWKGSVRTAASQVSSATLASTSSTLKNLPQQQIRTQQAHTQISFAANPKPSAASQGQPPPSNNQSPPPSMVVGSPTTSSISKSAGGSPRTTSTSTINKGGQTSSLSSQQAKNSPAVATQKSSPVGGRNIPSILGHPQSKISTSGSGSKPQLTQQHLQKQALQQQAQMYNAYMQAAQVQHATSSANNTSAAGGFYLQRHRSELPQQQSQGSSTSSSTGMLSLGPPTSLANTGTTDPAKAVAAAAAAVSANNMKGGSFPSLHAQFAAVQSSGKAHQLVPGFSFVHPVPSAVQVKPAEQKRPAGE